MNRTIAERVAAGTAWLDANRADWWQDIDLRSFDLASPCHCVLGQTDGNYWHALEMELGNSVGRAMRLGFTGDTGRPFVEQEAEFGDLEAEWRRIITERRAAAERAEAGA